MSEEKGIDPKAMGDLLFEMQEDEAKRINTVRAQFVGLTSILVDKGVLSGEDVLAAESRSEEAFGAYMRISMLTQLLENEELPKDKQASVNHTLLVSHLKIANMVGIPKEDIEKELQPMVDKLKELGVEVSLDAYWNR